MPALAPPVECVSDVRGGIGEGPLWDEARQCLWWVEILERKLHRFDPANGADRVFDMPSFIGCVALRGSGGLVVALQEGFAFFDPDTGALEIVPGYAPGDTARRFNDGLVSPEGRLLATTMVAAPPFNAPDQELVVLDADHGVRSLVAGLHIGNGLAFSNEGATLYLSDSHPTRNCIWAFDWDCDDGVATNRRLFYAADDIPGHPDGATVDDEGFYWFASAYGWRVVRLDPVGRVDRVIDVPVQKPTKIAFGGPGLATMYLTSIGTNLEPGTETRQPHAGGIHAFDPGTRGMLSHQFAG